MTPIHINHFGYELFEISAAAGSRLVLEYARGSQDKYRVVDQERIWGAYAGAKLAANITPEVAVAFDAKQMLGSNNKDNEMYQLSLRYRF